MDSDARVWAAGAAPPNFLEPQKKSTLATAKTAASFGCVPNIITSEPVRLTLFWTIKFRFVVSETESTLTSLVSRLVSSPLDLASKNATSCRMIASNRRCWMRATRRTSVIAVHHTRPPVVIAARRAVTTKPRSEVGNESGAPLAAAAPGSGGATSAPASAMMAASARAL